MDLKHARNLLTKERDRLQSLRDQVQSSGELDQTQRQSAGDLSSHDQHVGDAGTQTFQRERDESIEEMLEGEVREIEAALERVENIEYGLCETCGRPISEERLEALPATRYCREHAPAEEEVEAPANGWEITQELSGDGNTSSG